ncbi:MAG: esterase family protein [Prevotellaceae bacterium]|jgi:enterochelin esterase-like enzyme|nr:esterase family protein [Prevotellaceae bacterium]
MSPTFSTIVLRVGIHTNDGNLMKNHVLLLLVGCTLCVACQSGDDPEPEIVVGSGMVVQTNLSIASIYMQQSMKYNLLLPASYRTDTDKIYPVLYLLHGAGDDNTSWMSKGNALQLIQAAIEEGALPEIAVVMPDAQLTFYRGDYESYFFNELMPTVEKNYRIVSDAKYRFVAGLSMGGFGTMLYALKYPQKFSLAYSMSPYYDVASLSTYIKEEVAPSAPAIVIDAGMGDIVVGDGPERLHNALNKAGITHEWIYRNGGHDWVFWQASLENLIEKIAITLTNSIN